jgi:hypothetical protein
VGADFDDGLEGEPNEGVFTPEGGLPP